MTAPPDLRARALLGILDERGTIARAEARDLPTDEDGLAKRARFFLAVSEVRRVAERGQLRCVQFSTTSARHAAVDRLRKATRVSPADLAAATAREAKRSDAILRGLDRFTRMLAVARPARTTSTCSFRPGPRCDLVEGHAGCLSLAAKDGGDRSTLGDATNAVADWSKSRAAS